MARTKVTPRRRMIRRWPPGEAYQIFKIKTIMPEQKIVDIKKNRQVVRSIRVIRKTTKFTDKWARQF